MSTYMPKYYRYIVVCQNERQVETLFDRVAMYWRNLCNGRNKNWPVVNDDSKLIYGPMHSVQVISERQIFAFTKHKTPVRCRLVNGTDADRHLDRMFKEAEIKKQEAAIRKAFKEDY